MMRKCDGTDSNLVDEQGNPCKCGLEFDDIEYMVVYPHAYIPSREEKEFLIMIQEAVSFVLAMNREFPGMYQNQPLQPTVCVVEEAGEFAGAMRRLMGLARRTGTIQEAESELADVVISSYIAAEVYGFDLTAAIERKWAEIFSRGFKESR